MERPGGDPEVLLLKDLEKEYYRLKFLVDTGDEHIKKEMEISLQAGELVGVLYDALLAQYKNPDDPETLKSLNKLCVRLVFCLYAEDAGIFGGKSMFHDYLRDIPANGIRRALEDLFKILDQKPESRNKYLADDNPSLAAFPYVNGGLFSDEDIECYTMNNGYKQMKRVMRSEEDITALFAVSDSIAIGACKAVFDAGKSVPEDYSIAGFDGLEMARYYNPAITTIRQPVEEMAYATIRILFDIIRDKAQNQQKVFKGQLIEGQSTKAKAI